MFSYFILISKIKPALNDWAAFEKAQTELSENRDMAKSQEDKELAEMAAVEIPVLEQRLIDLEKSIQESILPPDPLEGRDVILEAEELCLKRRHGAQGAQLSGGRRRRQSERRRRTR